MNTIAEVSALDDGMPVTKLQATIARVGKPIEGTGQYGPYVFLPLTLSDRTGQISVSWTNPPNDVVAIGSGLQGQTVFLNSYPNKKGGMSGATKGSYQGKPQVKASGEGIRLEGATLPYDEPEPEKATTPATPSYQRATSPPAASQGHSKPTDEELIDRMLHWRSRLGIAFETEDALAKLVASLFIGVIQGNITLAQGDDEIPF